ncbi:MAG: DUF4231 domain-containing protein [Methylocella sp.]
MQRLEDQIQWYESRSIKNQRMFKVLKMIVIFAAALIPFLGHLEKYPFRAASKSDSKNLFEFDQWERCDWAIGFL